MEIALTVAVVGLAAAVGAMAWALVRRPSPAVGDSLAIAQKMFECYRAGQETRPAGELAERLADQVQGIEAERMAREHDRLFRAAHKAADEMPPPDSNERELAHFGADEDGT